jgi:hypothetical protein
MAESEEEREGNDPPNRASNSYPIDQVFEFDDADADTTVRPSTTPQQFPVSKEELARYRPEMDQVIIVDGPEDTTVRPRDPSIPIFWPEGVPMPWKTKRQPPEPPAEKS